MRLTKNTKQKLGSRTLKAVYERLYVYRLLQKSLLCIESKNHSFLSSCE